MMKLEYKPLPEAVDLRVGCKVQWKYYKTREEAEVASVAARYNGEIDRGRGYDFGYCSPGEIYHVPEGQGQYSGLFEVCTS